MQNTKIAAAMQLLQEQALFTASAGMIFNFWHTVSLSLSLSLVHKSHNVEQSSKLIGLIQTQKALFFYKDVGYTHILY